MLDAFGRTFESLRLPNYRAFFAGQVVSWTGTWVQWMAQGWLVLELTGSGFGLGIVAALQWLPVLLFGAWGGVLADRFEKRRVLLATNIASGALSLILGVVTVAGLVTLWMVILVALLLGIVTAIDNPARQTFTMEMVGRDRLTNAVSLNTATFTIARVMGPVIAGFTIAGVGIGECFLLNAASFVPVTVALLRMDRAALRPTSVTERGPGQVREGLRYVVSVPVLRRLLLIMTIVGTLEYNFQVILPVLARVTFGGDAKTFGLLGAFIGIGMLAGSLTNAAIGRPARRFLLGAGFALGVLTLLVASSPTVWLAALLLVPLGASSMVFLATMNSSLQLSSSDAMRGRVMALYFVVFLGSTPIGAPVVGWVAEVFDPRAALAVGGVATIAACLYGYFKLPVLGVRPGKDEEPSVSEAIAEAAIRE